MNLRLRLTLYYSAVLAVTLVSASLFLYWVTQRSLAREVDRNLVARSQEVVLSIRFASTHGLVLPTVGPFTSPGTYLQVVDASGTIIAQSGNLPPDSLPFSAATMERVATMGPFLETNAVEGLQLRLCNQPLYLGGSFYGLLQVGQSLASMQSTLGRLRWFLTIIILLTLLLAGMFGFLLASSALASINRMTRVAAAIGNGADLDRRVPYHGPQDEMGRLAATFNGMLGRLQETYRHLEEAYAAQKRFVADASHELRTPLTTIRGAIDLLKHQKAIDEEAREEILGDAASEAERMTRLLNSLLLLARADAGRKIDEMQVLELKPLLEEMARQAPHLGKADFVTEGLEDLESARVTGNADFLKQLFLILLDNAFKYDPLGRVTLRGVTSPHSWGVQVADTGRGIAADKLPHIFERFYRADPSREGEGSGLGLAIARWIVREHGGSIQVLSMEGKGTTFTVWLPKAENGSPEHPGIDDAWA